MYWWLYVFVLSFEPSRGFLRCCSLLLWFLGRVERSVWVGSTCMCLWGGVDGSGRYFGECPVGLSASTIALYGGTREACRPGRSVPRVTKWVTRLL